VGRKSSNCFLLKNGNDRWGVQFYDEKDAKHFEESTHDLPNSVEDKYGRAPTLEELLFNMCDIGNEEGVRELLKAAKSCINLNWKRMGDVASPPSREIDFVLFFPTTPTRAPRGDSMLTALYQSTRTPSKEIARMLIEAGANVNELTEMHQTPLLSACWRGDYDMVKLLLDSHADPNIPAFGNITPLFVACTRNNPEIAKVLIENGADANVTESNMNLTPLFKACMNGSEDIVRYLLDSGVDVNSEVMMHGQTPLFISSWNGNEKLVKLLLERGAKIEKEDSFGQTALHASFQGNLYSNITKILIKFIGSKVEWEDSVGRTPLYLSAIFGFIDVWCLLMGMNFSLPSRREPKIINKEVLLGSKYKNVHSSEIAKVVNLETKLGKGSFGEVWKGRIGETIVAIKFLQNTQENTLNELIEETSLMGFVGNYSNI
jgi:ankyrin repeat protein